MNRNKIEELRGGGGCCKNKNNTSSISSFEGWIEFRKIYSFFIKIGA